MTRQIQSLFNSLRTGAAILSADGCIVYCNGALAELLGIPLRQAREKRIADCLSEAARPAFAKLLTRAATARVESQFPIERPGRPPVTARLWLSPAPQARHGFYLEAMVVTGDALGATFRAVFDRAPLGINVTTPDGRLTQVNQAFCEFTG